MKKAKKGFTLVELVIVIAVIAVLAAVLIPTFSGILQRAKESSRKTTATSARDEIFTTGDYSSIDELRGYLINVDGVYYMISSNGEMVNKGTNLEDISAELNLNYSSFQNASNGVVIYIPDTTDAEQTTVPSEGGVYNSNGQLTKTWEDLVSENKIFVNSGSLTGVFFTEPTTLVISDDITHIYINSINKSMIETLYIPASVSDFYISEMSYYNMDNEPALKEIVVDGSNEIFYTDGIGLYSSDTLVMYALASENESYEVKSTVTINGVESTITTLAPEVFKGALNLTNITIPSTITNLSYDKLDESMLTLDDGTYYLPAYNNPYYYAVKSNSSTISIHQDAVVVCSKFVPYDYLDTYAVLYNYIDYAIIPTLYIGANLEKINEDAFAIARISNFVVDPENEHFSTNQDGTILYNGTKLVAYANGNNTSVSNLDLSETQITEICSYAFMGNSTITSVTLPATLEKIGDYAFLAFQGNGTISFDDNTVGVEVGEFSFSFATASVNTFRHITIARTHAFEYFNGSNTVLDLDKIVRIEDWAFNNTGNPVTVQFGENLEYIGSNVFAYGGTVSSLYIPKNVSYIGPEMANAYSLQSFSIDPENEYYTTDGTGLYHGTTLIQIMVASGTNSTYTVKEGTTAIGTSDYYGNGVFQFCYNMQTVILPSSLKYICQSAFSGTYVQTISLNEGLEFIGDNAFSGTQIASLTIPSTATQITENSFGSMGYLTYIAVASGHPTLHTDANHKYLYNDTTLLLGVNGITSFSTEGTTITNICDGAFMNVNSLVNVDLAGVTYIGYNAFNGTGITSFTVPASYVDFTVSCFEGMNYLQNVYVEEGHPFLIADSTHKILYSDDYSELYYVVKNYSGTVTLHENTTEIKDYAMYACAVTNIVFNANLETIGEKALSQTGLSGTVDLTGTKLKEIKNNGFENNLWISSYIFPSTLKTVGDNAFSYSESLSSVTFQEGLLTIGYGAFDYCNNLTSIVIPASVTSIDARAFNDCCNLTEITFNHTQITDLFSDNGSSAFLIGPYNETINTTVRMHRVGGQGCIDYDWADNNRNATIIYVD